MRKSAGHFETMIAFEDAVRAAFERGHVARALGLEFGPYGFDHVIERWLAVGAIEIDGADAFGDNFEVTWTHPALALFFGQLGDADAGDAHMHADAVDAIYR